MIYDTFRIYKEVNGVCIIHEGRAYPFGDFFDPLRLVTQMSKELSETGEIDYGGVSYIPESNKKEMRLYMVVTLPRM